VREGYIPRPKKEGVQLLYDLRKVKRGIEAHRLRVRLQTPDGDWFDGI
jgi:hypothetical protein